MSDARFVLLVLALLAASPGAAQVRPSDAELRARVDSLARELERADATLDSAIDADRQRRMAGGAGALDTQRVGPLTVVALREDADAARAVTERALERVGELGRGADSPLNGFTLLVEDGRRVLAFADMKGPDAAVVWLPSYTRGERRTGAVLRVLHGRLARALPADLQEWLAGTFTVDNRDVALADVYRSLAVASSHATGRCHRGETAACVGALGLSDPGPAWRNWYTREELAAWARVHTPGWNVSDEGEREAFDACYYRGDASACAFAAAHGQTPAAPLSTQARATLVAYALERGGADAYALLRADTRGALLERIARAGGTTPDSIVAGWRERVMRARPVASADLGGSLFVTLLWTVALSVLAMRSKRWRLG